MRDDKNHVTHFNKLIWDNGHTPASVIDHRITMPTTMYSGELESGIVAITNRHEHGRRLQLDIVPQPGEHIASDLIRMDTRKPGGSGEILHPQLPEFVSRVSTLIIANS